MAEYWLADADARVLGPIGLDVLQDLAAAGKLAEVRAVSRDGRTFSPVAHFPEVAAALAPRGADQAAAQQAIAVQRLRQWLEEVRRQQPHELFRVPANAPTQSYRAAFFTLIKRFYPDRLAPDASLELRQACEDVFLFLASRMLEVERSHRVQPPPAPSPAGKSELVGLEWRGGSLDVKLKIRAHDVRFFTMHPEANFRADSVFIESHENVTAGTPVNVSIQFEGHPSNITAWGRVVRSDAPKGSLPKGFGVKLLDLGEGDRSFIRTWIARSSARQG